MLICLIQIIVCWNFIAEFNEHLKTLSLKNEIFHRYLLCFSLREQHFVLILVTWWKIIFQFIVGFSLSNFDSITFMPNIEIEPRSKGANRRRTYIYFCHFHNPKFKDISISNTPLWLAFLPHATIKPVIYQPYSFVTTFYLLPPTPPQNPRVFYFNPRFWRSQQIFDCKQYMKESVESLLREYFVINRRSSQRKNEIKKQKNKKKWKWKYTYPGEYIGIHNIKFE